MGRQLEEQFGYKNSMLYENLQTVLLQLKLIILWMCQHSKRLKLFCLSSECTHIIGYGCADCMRKAHKGGSESQLISEQDLSKAMKTYQIPGHIKEERKKTVLKVYQALTSLKNQICDSLDSYFNSILSKVKYPFLYHEDILDVYRTIRDRNFHRVDRPSLTKFWTLTASLHPEEFIAKEVSIYQLYLKETLASFQTLASSMEHIEEIFSFKVSYHTRILQNEVSEELAHVLKKHPDTASKPQSNSQNEPSSPVSKPKDCLNPKQDFFSTPRKQMSNQESRQKKDTSIVSSILRRSFEQTPLKWEQLSKNSSSASKSNLQVERTALQLPSSTDRLEELPIMKALKNQSIYSNTSSLSQATHSPSLSISQQYTAQVENQTILIKITEASDRFELAKIDNLPAKIEEGKSLAVRESESKSGTVKKEKQLVTQQREDNIRKRLQGLLTHKQVKVSEKHIQNSSKTQLRDTQTPQKTNDKQQISNLKDTNTRQSFYLSVSHKRRGSRNESEMNDSLSKEIFDFAREEKPKIISRSIKKEIPLTAELSNSKIEASSRKSSFSESADYNLREEELQMAAIFLSGINQPTEENKMYFLQKYVQRYKSNLTAIEYLSFLYLQRGRFKQCCTLSNKILDNLKSSREKGDCGLTLVVNKAAALNNMGRYSQTIKLLEQVKVECDKVHKNLGDAYYNIQMLDKAIYHYQRAIKLNAKLDEAYFNLAVILYRQGSHFNAKMNIQKAIALNSSDPAYCELKDHITERIKMNEDCL